MKEIIVTDNGEYRIIAKYIAIVDRVHVYEEWLNPDTQEWELESEIAELSRKVAYSAYLLFSQNKE